jgi:endonuclease YncB( thermonuclease family)
MAAAACIATFDHDRPAERGWLRAGCRAMFAALAVLFLLAASLPARADVSGPARIVDGDTIEIADQKIRLHGIDAPEQAQRCLVGTTPWRCGRAATRGLAAAVDGRPVECVGDKRDRWGRLIAVCYAGGQNLNAYMVRSGLALAYRRYAEDYVGEEADARADAVGMWRGSFVEPWGWRRGQRVVAATE